MPVWLTCHCNTFFLALAPNCLKKCIYSKSNHSIFHTLKSHRYVYCCRLTRRIANRSVKSCMSVVMWLYSNVRLLHTEYNIKWQEVTSDDWRLINQFQLKSSGDKRHAHCHRSRWSYSALLLFRANRCTTWVTDEHGCGDSCESRILFKREQHNVTCCLLFSFL